MSANKPTPPAPVLPQLSTLATELSALQQRLAALEARLPALEGREACSLLRRLTAASRHLEEARHALLGTTPVHASPVEVVHAPSTGLEGSTRTVPLQDLFSFLATTGRVGVLRVQTDEERFVVQFDQGAVCYAFGDRVPPGEALGDILCAEGVLTDEQLELLPERAAQEAWLEPALIESGWIARRDLESALARQTRAAFLRLCHVDEARYAFVEGGSQPEWNGTRYHPVELLLEASRLSDEQRWRAVESAAAEAPRGLSDACLPGAR